MAPIDAPTAIKTYANRLSNPAAGRYVPLGDLATMVEDDEEFTMSDAKSGEDVTRWVLRQIIRGHAHHG